MNNAAWAYLVVSSGQQAETLENQEGWARKTAAKNGWTITHIEKGVSSGKSGLRELMGSVMDRLRRLPPSERPVRLLMIRLDRFGRDNPLEMAGVMGELQKLRVTIHTRDDGDYKIGKAADAIIPMMKFVLACVENEVRVDHLRGHFDGLRAKGLVLCHKRAYGLKLVDGKDVPDEPRATVVRKAFELACNGYGYGQIGQKLRQIAEPKVYLNGRQHATEWTRDRVMKLLRNPAYRGTVVDVAIWERGQLMGKSTLRGKAKTKHPYPLSGCLHCGCGRMLIGSIRGSCSTPQRVYRCSAKGVHGRIITHAGKAIEAQFVDLLRRLRAAPGLIKQFQALDREAQEGGLDLMGRRRAELRRQISDTERNQTKVFDLHAAGKVDDDDVRPQLRRLRAKQEELEEELRELDRALAAAAEIEVQRTNVRELIERASTLWELAPLEDRRELARSVASAIGGVRVDDLGRLHVGLPTNTKRFTRIKMKTAA